ncbi:MAG: hypothetical protein NTY69_11315 [Methylococcales bacterium]|nr:hypothetical protein [Methylococcales bacterium]
MNENVDDHDKISDEFFDNHSESEYAECGNWEDPIITDIVEVELQQWEIDKYCEDEEDLNTKQ